MKRIFVAAVNMKDIYDAAEKGDIEKVKSLIEKGEDINQKNAYGFTPFHCALRWGHIKIVEYLIEDINNGKNAAEVFYHNYGCDIELRDFNYIARKMPLEKFKKIQPEVEEYKKMCGRFL